MVLPFALIAVPACQCRGNRIQLGVLRVTEVACARRCTAQSGSKRLSGRCQRALAGEIAVDASVRACRGIAAVGFIFGFNASPGASSRPLDTAGWLG